MDIEAELLQSEILTYPNRILMVKADPISNIDEEIRNYFDRMVRIMYQYDGIGLAAPQIGLSLRLIVVRRDNWIYKLINPKISWMNGEAIAYEGCLSLPNEIWQVDRAKEVVVEGIDSKGNEQAILVNDLLARVFQHEIDHLDGIMINSIGTLIEQ